jgi:hypothetical protein
LLTRVEEELARVDPDEVLARHAPEVWDLCDRGEKLFGGAKIRMARRVDDSGVHKDTAAGSTAEYLALRSGASNQAAADMLATSRHLQALAATDTAVRAGLLSATQAHLVASAATVNPGKEAALLDLARNASNKELRDEALRTKAAADPDPEATRERHRRNRYFRQGTTADGAWWFTGRGPADDAGRFNAALNPLLENIFRNARSQSRREPREAYAYDSLQQMARRAHTTNDDADSTATATSPNHHPQQADQAERDDQAEQGHEHADQPDRQRGTTDNSDRPERDHQHSARQRGPADQNEPGGQVNHDDQVRQQDQAGRDHTGHDHSDQAGRDHTGHDHSDRPERGGRTKRRDRNVDGAGVEPAADAGTTNTNGHDAPVTPDTRTPGPDHTNRPDPDSNNEAGTQPPTEPDPGAAARPSTRPGRRPNLNLLPVLRLDLPALHRGHLQGSEICEITGIGPITIPAARELLHESIIKLVLSNNGNVVTVTHIGVTPAGATHLAILHADITGLTQTTGLTDTTALTEAAVNQADKTCIVPGAGAVPTNAARRLLGELSGRDVLEQVLTRGCDVANLTHRGRQPTAAQRTALLWAQPACSVIGCPRTFTQIDHRTDWSRQNVTTLDNLDRLCPRHHQQKTAHNYQLTPGNGDRAFVPPTDPRHPDHRATSNADRGARHAA